MTQIAMYSQQSMVKALQVNSVARGFVTFNDTIIRPDYAYGQVLPGNTTGVQRAADGFFEASGIFGQESPARLKLVPYCEDSPGTQFSVRLYAWHQIANPDESGMIWSPTFLVELLCTAGSIPGIKGRWIKDTENRCEVISLTRGNLGPWYGAIYSPGASTGLIAFAMVDLSGARFFSFDFAAFNPVSNAGMNCLWGRA